MPPKKRRRPRGEGALYQRKSDKLWIGAVFYEDDNGDEQRASVSSMDKAKTMEKFRELKREIAAGTYTPRSKMTVEQWMTYWVEEMIKPNRSPKTYDSYKGIVKNQIVHFVGSERLPVTGAVIRGNLKKVGAQWSPRTTVLTYTVWNMAMKAAKAEGIIKANPVENVTKPMDNSSIGKALTSEQARKVLLSALAAEDRMVTRWASGLLLGTRQGETLGLERDRVDLEALTVDLSWQLQSLKTKPGAGMDDPDRFVVPKGFEIRPLYRRFALTRPKTERSKRLTPLPVPLAAILKTYMETTATNRFGLMWVTEPGTPIPNKYDSDAWHAALARAGVPDVRLHDARHTTATLLLEMGVEEAVRMQIMGQNTVAAARIYAHVDLTQARSALGNLDGLLALG
jgi:integrase